MRSTHKPGTDYGIDYGVVTALLAWIAAIIILVILLALRSPAEELSAVSSCTVFEQQGYLLQCTEFRYMQSKSPGTRR